MKITEARLRQILREESRRVRLFEAPADDGDTGTASVSAPAPAQAAPAAPATPAAPSAPVDPAAAADAQLEADLKDIMFGAGGTAETGRDSASNSTLTGTDPLLYCDMNVDALGPLSGGMEGQDDGDLDDLPSAYKQEIFDQVLSAAKSGTLNADSLYKIVNDKYKEAFPALDNLEREDRTYALGTDFFWRFISAAIMKWKKAGGKPGGAVAPAPSPTPTPGPGPTPTPGTKTYTVVRGDTLSQICLRFYGNGTPPAYKALAAALNKPDPNVIKVNEKLALPTSITVNGAALQRRDTAPIARGSGGTLTEGRRKISINWGI